MTAKIFKLYPYQRQAIDALSGLLGREALARRDYAEASFFDGYHYQHIADWLDVARLKRAEDAHAAFRRRHPNISNLWD